MKYKVFYDSKTMKIKGYSDGELSMELPYIETDYNLHLMWNFKIEDGEVKPIKKQFTKDEWDKIIKIGRI